MAWTGTDLNAYDKFLKEWYMGKWVDLMNNLTTTYRLFRRRIVSFKGRRMIIALRTKRTGAVGAISVSGYGGSGYGAQNLLAPGYQGTDNAIVRPKIVMGAIGIPQDVIDTSAGDKASFYEVVDFEMMGLKVDMSLYLDILKYCGGAPLCDIYGTPTVGTPSDFEVTNPSRFYPGQLLDFWSSIDDSSTPVRRASASFPVQSVSGNTVTVTGSVTGLVEGDYPYYAGARSASTSYEPLGFEEIYKPGGASTTALAGNLLLNTYDGGKELYGIERETGEADYNSNWGATTINRSGGELEFEHLHRLCDEIHDNSGGDPTILLTNRISRRLVAKKMAYVTPTVYGTPSNTAVQTMATQRFINTTKLKGGFIGRREDMHGEGGNDWVMFDDRLPLVVDRVATHDHNADTGTIWALDTRHYFDAQVTDWRWWAPQGSILREARNIGATNAGDSLFGVVAHCYQFYESVCTAPNTGGAVYGFDVSGVL
jgi:hypothetical protein